MARVSQAQSALDIPPFVSFWIDFLFLLHQYFRFIRINRLILGRFFHAEKTICYEIWYTCLIVEIL